MLPKIELKLDIIIIAGVLATIASGCSFNPQTEIHSHLPESTCPPEKNAIEDFRILGSRDWSRGKIVVYEAICRSKDPSQPSMQLFGHQIFVRSLFRWQFISGGTSGSSLNAQPSPKQLVDYSSGSGGSGNYQRAVVSGRILNPEVTAVIAIFNNGRIIRDSGADGIFAMVSSGASEVCELRVLGANGKVLQKYKPGSLNGDLPGCK
ncbi:MAG: hypothetical protein QNJ47_09365 [Nostocaceae cyanobacterium]|nr:hypothetical protein [Nostocaceae cyanobacterium]